MEKLEAKVVAAELALGLTEDQEFSERPLALIRTFANGYIELAEEYRKKERGLDFVRERCQALIAQAERHKDDTYTDTETRVEHAKIMQLGSAAEILLSDLGYALRGEHIPYTKKEEKA
jgi:hypothetical protein